ncbi:hypothetical protein E2320_009503, partial [Naja naja]
MSTDRLGTTAKGGAGSSHVLSKTERVWESRERKQILWLWLQTQLTFYNFDRKGVLKKSIRDCLTMNCWGVDDVGLMMMMKYSDFEFLFVCIYGPTRDKTKRPLPVNWITKNYGKKMKNLGKTNIGERNFLARRYLGDILRCCNYGKCVFVHYFRNAV